jgi:two-component system response regulator AtoC
MSNASILVVDDQPNGRRTLELMLQSFGWDVVCAEHGRHALEMLHTHPVDLVVTDLNMPEMGGLELLETLRTEGNTVPVIVVTAYGAVETAVAAMKLGAADYLVRPLDIDETEMAVRRALDLERIVRENLFLRDELEKGWDEFVGQSEPMRQIYSLIQQVGPSKASVLISGETGTGKELAARAVHRNSGRKGLFIPINCAAIPVEILESELFGHLRGAFTGAIKDKPGKFELASGGTIFLDEITEMPIALQSKLLRVLQEGVVDRLGSTGSTPVDIRVIAATNRDPRATVKDGLLREDLYYRLNVVELQLPPLRERRDDIPMLATHFIQKYATQLRCPTRKLSVAAEHALMNYRWPGNVRELENVMERSVVLSRSEFVDVDHLPPEIMDPELEPADSSAAALEPTDTDLDLERRVSTLEVQLIREALAQTADNKAKAARLLNVSERTLWYKLKKYSL